MNLKLMQNISQIEMQTVKLQNFQKKTGEYLGNCGLDILFYIIPKMLFMNFLKKQISWVL